MYDGILVEEETTEARFQRGLARLISYEGPIEIWVARITRPVLIGSSRDCMYGQLYGSYGNGLLVHNMADDYEAYRHGFMCFEHSEDEPAMNALWEQVLQEARAT